MPTVAAPAALLPCEQLSLPRSPDFLSTPAAMLRLDSPPERNPESIVFMSRPKGTIRISDALSRVIGPTEALTERVTAIAVRYEQFVTENMPTLSREEWCAIMDANNGGSDWIAESQLMTCGIWANVDDSPELDEKWGIDRAGLVSRMRQMSTSELLAVDEAISRFWQRCDAGTADALVLAGCRLSESVSTIK